MTGTAPPAGGRALVVEDEEDTRRFFVHCLTTLGFAVDSADNGMTALEMATAADYEVVVCDIRLPKLSGNSFLTNLALRAPSPRRRIVVVSSLEDSRIKREALAAGAATYLVKPVSSSALMAAVAGERLA